MKEDKRVEKRQKARKTWEAANDGLHIRRLTCCAFDPFCPELVVAGTAGGGFVKARWKNENKPDRKDDGNERR